MAAINFPAASESPWYNPDNGITYEYIGGTWRSVNQLSGAFDDTYVEVAGDNMTGNLTLGTDKITLDATDGSATFADGETIIFNNGSINAQNSNGGSTAAIQVKQSDDNSRTILLRSDGHIDIGGTLESAIGSSNPNTRLAPDGSAEFAGGGTFGSNCSISRDTTDNANQLLKISNANNSSGANKLVVNGEGLYIGEDVRPGSAAIDANIDLNADGSATFAGRVNAGSSTLNDSIGLAGYNNSNINQHPTLFLRNYGSSNTGLLIEGRNNAGTTVYTVDSQGNSSFSALTLNLETDNPANYTTTTSIETDPETGEETTIETSVYNGPTLDVKERLQNLISRIDAIEANEIIDDATDNSLLLAIAELTSRLDERDATIADLQARITTLES